MADVDRRTDDGGNDHLLKPRSDLGIRTASGAAMLVTAVLAYLTGALVFRIFVGVVLLGVLWEYRGLAWRIGAGPAARLMWLGGGVLYIGLAGISILTLSDVDRIDQLPVVVALIAAVVGTDVGAYVVGRTVGGPKIALRISPSKTWSGLLGGMIGAGIAYTTVAWFEGLPADGGLTWVLGAITAIVAQSGDFFESWLKRRAGVKDSGNLIPGHGGLFDRLDGMLAVFVAAFFWTLATFLWSGGG